jgi:hypothetical protein
MWFKDFPDVADGTRRLGWSGFKNTVAGVADSGAWRPRLENGKTGVSDPGYNNS